MSMAWQSGERRHGMPVAVTGTPTGGTASPAAPAKAAFRTDRRLPVPRGACVNLKSDNAMDSSKIRSILLIVAGLLLMLLAASIAFGGEDDLSGEWKGSHFLSRIDARVDQHDERLDGVLTVIGPFNRKDVYHFTGSFKDGQVTGSHYTGHSFRGRVCARGRVCGLLTTRTGTAIEVEVERFSKPQHIAARGLTN